MVTLTRLDCVLGSAGQIRAALTQAAWYAAHRTVSGRPLVDWPAMTAVLADLAVESWAATLTAIRLADLVQLHRALPGGDPRAAALLRIALPVAKFWICKRAVPVIAEALECLGGNGYVETYPMARLLREAPLNGIWEGSGTVAALDAVRALHRNQGAGDALLAEVRTTRGVSATFDAALSNLEQALFVGADPEQARAIGSLSARLLAASLLIRQAPAEVADLYCATRLGGRGDRVFGELPATEYPLRDIVDAVTPGR
jgi:putative acyl-CoA dehydrogenase